MYNKEPHGTTRNLQQKVVLGHDRVYFHQSSRVPEEKNPTQVL